MPIAADLPAIEFSRSPCLQGWRVSPAKVEHRVRRQGVNA